MAAKKKSTSKKNTNQQGKSEAIGILIIAFALFLGVSLYSTAVGVVGEAVAGFAFAIFGFMGYTVPVLLLVWGIYVIAASKKSYRPLTIALCMLGGLFILVLLQIFSDDNIADMAAVAYFKQAYVYGASYRLGGGFLGALLAYPSLYLIGKIGACIFYIAGILIITLFVTKLSIKSAGHVIGETIKEGVAAVSEISHTRKSMYIEDMNSPYEDIGKAKKSKRAKRTVASIDDTVDILPVRGPIAKKDVVQNTQTVDLFADDDYEYVPHHECEDCSDSAETAPQPKAQPKTKQVESIDPFAELPADSADSKPPYMRPPLSLLNLPKSAARRTGESAAEKARKLEEALASFNISAKVVNIIVGPVITRYEVQPAQGVRVNRITALSDDLALALAAKRVRIEAPIPGKAAIGIEIPNNQTMMVSLREVVDSPEFEAETSAISFALGRDIAGKIITADLDSMPHLLIGGSTGSGKSVCINDIIISMVYKATPDELGLILIDPKVVELSVFSPLPHLLIPVVSDPKRASGALKWAIRTIEERYNEMKDYGVRNVAGYNALNKPGLQKMKRIVVVIDELADLMMVAGKEVEESICRIGQIGRAAGVHLIVATQRPSADVITGLIKANLPSRIAFMVSSLVDSRVILDSSGAEKLLGKGDMLFHKNGANKATRIQGAFVADAEVQRLADFFEQQNEGKNTFDETIMQDIALNSTPGASGGGGDSEDEPRFAEAVAVVVSTGQASASWLQRRMSLGYARASRLMDAMEAKGYVGKADGAKPRSILITREEYEATFGRSPDNV